MYVCAANLYLVTRGQRKVLGPLELVQRRAVTLQSSEEGPEEVRFPGAADAGSCEVLYGYWEQNLESDKRRLF